MHAIPVYIAFLGAFLSPLPLGLAIQKGLIITLFIFFIILNIKNKFPKSSIVLISPYLIYIFYCSLSALVYSESISYVFKSLLPLSIGLIFYFYIISINLSAFSIDSARKQFLFLCMIQISFCFLKLIVHGVDEKFLIGTMSHVAGQLGFLFPAIAIPLTFYFFKSRSQLYMWLLLVGLMSFGIINEKRSFVFVAPFIIYASYFVNNSFRLKHDRLKSVFSLFFISLFILGGSLIGLAFIPSLNVEENYGGSLNIKFALEYAFNYLTMNYGGPLQGSYLEATNNVNIQVGRLTLLLSIMDWLNNSSWFVQLFGIGFGAVTPSEWLGGRDDPLFNVLGTRGAISGAGLALIETGVIGFAILLYFFLKIHCKIKLLIKNSNNLGINNWFKTVNIIFYIFIYDFFFYSTVLFRVLPLPIIFFGIIATLTLVKSKPNILKNTSMDPN